MWFIIGVAWLIGMILVILFVNAGKHKHIQME